MEAGGHAPKAQSKWLEAKLRVWCVGGWWFQIAGSPRQRIDGNDAASALLRHLAVGAGETRKSELQRWLSRAPDRPVGVDSFNTAVSRLRGMLREAAGGGEEGDALASELLPRAGIGLSADGISSEATYKLGEAVWVDLHDAASLALCVHLVAPSHGTDASGGRGVKGELQGQERLRRDVDERLARASAPLSEKDLDTHLKNLKPPISSLTALVPMALDRLRQGRMLSILAGPDSGRTHLAEAVELAARVYCGRSTEQIREQPKGGTLADDSDLRADQPGHLCVLDLTRPVRQEQIERLRKLGEGGDTGTEGIPALLLVREGPLPSKLSFLASCWGEEEPVQLPAPQQRDVLEAYLIATEGGGSVARRQSDFTTLWRGYEDAHGAAMGLTAAVLAAGKTLERGAPPAAEELRGPPSQGSEFRELNGQVQYLARCLAWFGNRPFDLEDAREASGDEDLEEGDILDITTRMSGGRKMFELRPQLLDVARPPAEAHRRICQYLVTRENPEPIVERWPGRALRILGRDSVPIEDRLDLALVLFETCRDQGLAKRLAQTMKKLRAKAGPGLDERLARFEIERARLLTHLGDFEEADAVLGKVTEAKGRGGEWPALRGRARLRRAIAASRLGDAERAKREAREAFRHPRLRVKVENFRGWEATNTARFEDAISHFTRALELGGDAEERADAVVGMARGLIRLGRSREAEEVLEELGGLNLRRHTRDRVARVQASLCHLRGDPSGGIDHYIDPALLSASSNYSSASALLLEASAFLHLEAKEVNAAEEDIERSLSVLRNSGGRPSSATHYVHALIYEAQAEAARGPVAADGLARARQEAEKCIGTDIERNPWALARAHTLRARLALRAEDRQALARCLDAALASHRKLDLVCPGVLSQTLQLAANAASVWGMEGCEERLRELVGMLDPQQSLRPVGLEEALAPVSAVLKGVESGPPQSPSGAGGSGLEAMDRVGRAISESMAQAQLAGLRLQVLVPRRLDGLAEGLYEISADAETLLRHPRSPARATDLIPSEEERRVVRRHATSVLLVFAPARTDEHAYLLVGQWLTELKAIARKHGVAVLESIPLDTGGLEEVLGGPAAGAMLALALVEMPVLS